MRDWFINGKFLAQRTTGVQRVAAQLVAALDRRLAAGDGPPGRWVLLVPPGAAPPALAAIETRIGGPAGSLHRWEQGWLPWAAREGRLLNLAGSAPALARRTVCLIHDAAVFDHPEAYTRPFVAWYRFLFRRLARRADRLLTVSDFSRARLEAVLDVHHGPIAVVPNGADHLADVVPDRDWLAAQGLAGTRFLLAVGSANPTKNLDAVVAAFARLPQAGDLRLAIAGGRHERVFAAGAGAADPPGVLRVGPVDDGPLKALYGQALGLVFPSTYEGFGLPPLEAMACGCPVIASDAASLPEVCGDAAILVDPRSEVEIADAMANLVEDPLLRDALRRRGRVQAARYTWDRAAAALAVALASLAD